MHFLARIFDHLEKQPERCKLVEVHGTELREHDGGVMLGLIARARAFVAAAGVQPGDRVALLAPNSVRWVCADLAVLACGAIVVPLYDKQEPRELAVMLRSAEPVLLLAGTRELADTIAAAWPEHGRIATLDEVFEHEPSKAGLHDIAEHDPVAIIYTSGTSGEPKGVVLDRGNLDFMVPRIIGRLDMVAGKREGGDRVFHFLPLCFAASRMMLWTQLSRPNPLMMSTDLTNLVQEMATAKPNYFLNVPAVLERIRNGVNAKLRERGGIALSIYERGVKAWRAQLEGRAGFVDRIALGVARKLVFDKVKQTIGPNLDFLISGSAPLSEDTQRWFQMIGIAVYQAYGLTETTGLVSLDEPDRTVPGRVGIALPGVEAKITDEGELVVRGPNIFSGYWRKPEETAKVLRDGWFHTGDQMDILEGNLKIIGRIKNLIVPESGHNIAPEPLEEKFMAACPAATQCMVVGHARPFVAIVLPGKPPADQVDRALEQINAELPAYRRIRRAIYVDDAFTVDNGLLTANQKLRRAVIEGHFKPQIDAAYEAVKAERAKPDAGASAAS
ncbi:MAG: AMP-binding protein [Deltaproteobacteria bacterium]|nr:AMP-binding protein [Nannocystaceae bacterium]